MKKQKFFDSTIKLYEAYRSKMLEETPKEYDSALSYELLHRLRQLSFIYEKVRSYNQKITNPISATNVRITNTEGAVFAETFYYFAWRIMTFTDHKTNPLPGLRGLKKRVKGILLVRNCLIEHPEGKKIFNISYSWSDAEGPRLKIARPAGQSFEISDRGLWINAQEFKDGLEELLQEAIK